MNQKEFPNSGNANAAELPVTQNGEIYLPETTTSTVNDYQNGVTITPTEIIYASEPQISPLNNFELPELEYNRESIKECMRLSGYADISQHLSFKTDTISDSKQGEIVSPELDQRLTSTLTNDDHQHQTFLSDHKDSPGNLLIREGASLIDDNSLLKNTPAEICAEGAFNISDGDIGGVDDKVVPNISAVQQSENETFEKIFQPDAELAASCLAAQTCSSGSQSSSFNHPEMQIYFSHVIDSLPVGPTYEQWAHPELMDVIPLHELDPLRTFDNQSSNHAHEMPEIVETISTNPCATQWSHPEMPNLVPHMIESTPIIPPGEDLVHPELPTTLMISDEVQREVLPIQQEAFPQSTETGDSHICDTIDTESVTNDKQPEYQEQHEKLEQPQSLEQCETNVQQEQNQQQYPPSLTMTDDLINSELAKAESLLKKDCHFNVTNGKTSCKERGKFSTALVDELLSYVATNLEMIGSKVPNNADENLRGTVPHKYEDIPTLHKPCERKDMSEITTNENKHCTADTANSTNTSTCQKGTELELATNFEQSEFSVTKTFNLLMKLQRNIASLQLQMSKMQENLRQTNSILQEVIDDVCQHKDLNENKQ